MPRASERPKTGCNLEHRRDKMIAQDTAELIILLKGCSQHWLKRAVGLKPITLGCPLTHRYWILHEQSFPAPSSLPCPGWLAHSLLALDLFTYLLRDANFRCDRNGVYPRSLTWNHRGRGEIDNVCLPFHECLMKPTFSTIYLKSFQPMTQTFSEFNINNTSKRQNKDKARTVKSK